MVAENRYRLLPTEHHEEGREPVAIRAVVFDVGGILEVTPSLNVEEKWEPEFGAEFHTGLSEVWSAGSVGAITLEQVHEELGRIIGAGPDRIAAFM
jgi:putative hydrolase of the HAD superfamily